MWVRDAGIAQANGCDRVEHEEEYKQRDAQADQPILDETPRPLALERTWREVTGNQEQETHKVSLVDGYKNDQHGERQWVDGSRLHVIEGACSSVDDSQMRWHHSVISQVRRLSAK
jgi:hypothetical protein